MRAVPKYIVVLASGPLGENNTFPEYHNNMYLGGHTRMLAAVRILQHNSNLEMTLVGGFNPDVSEDVPMSNKLDDMASFLYSRTPSARLHSVCSLPCTRHNFKAVFASWKADGIKLVGNEVGILTNAYHLPRAKLFAEREATEFEQYKHLEFMSISAEEILGISLETIAAADPAAYAKRIASELQGVSQIIDGTYADGCLSHAWSLESAPRSITLSRL